MKNYLLKNATIINEGEISNGDVLLKNGRIELVAPSISTKENVTEINAEGKHLLPGVIDDQVHFREPGLTHKAEIYTESRAAVAGGTTSFMDMPNVKPASLTQELLEERYAIAAKKSPANFSFYMGASNDNLEEVLKTNPQNICGVKAFMGSSTGNMLVDAPKTLEALFSKCPMLIATHCEDEATVRANTAAHLAEYGEDIPIEKHPIIRDEIACLKSSSFAAGLAKKHGTRLHILHITTADELPLFDNSIPLSKKKITSEVCVHHLWFDSRDYEALGTKIKCNPAIKVPQHKPQLLEALLDNRIDIIATDHAPHTLEEKQNIYTTQHFEIDLIIKSLSKQKTIETHKVGTHCDLFGF